MASSVLPKGTSSNPVAVLNVYRDALNCPVAEANDNNELSVTCPLASKNGTRVAVPRAKVDSSA